MAAVYCDVIVGHRGSDVMCSSCRGFHPCDFLLDSYNICSFRCFHSFIYNPILISSHQLRFIAFQTSPLITPHPPAEHTKTPSPRKRTKETSNLTTTQHVCIPKHRRSPEPRFLLSHHTARWSSPVSSSVCRQRRPPQYVIAKYSIGSAYHL
jgi:hypothetical protein